MHLLSMRVSEKLLGGSILVMLRGASVTYIDHTIIPAHFQQ